jgi:hypothetical protein
MSMFAEGMVENNNLCSYLLFKRAYELKITESYVGKTR